MEELLEFFEILINTQGTKLNEAVLNDPEVIEWMASIKDDRRRTVPIYGQTEIVSLLKTLIDVTAGDDIMPRHKIPGHELRLNRHVAKTNSSIEKAQERSRKYEEATRKREERDRLAALKTS
jgi:hypothetical protein